MLKSKFFLFLFSSICLYTSSFAQGTIFSRSEADDRFGPVLISADIPVNIINEFGDRAGNQLMFKIINEKPVILTNNRAVLYSDSDEGIGEQDVYTVFSTSVIKELIRKGQETHLEIEQRNDVLSITCGDFTVEVGTLCPPFCL